jgi:carbon dioxide concentrating mechanism protein CcmN
MPVTLDRLIIGDVQIDSSAAIAPGVILQADPGSSIVIGAGVCIGMGAIIHARNGNISINPGTNLAAGVLIVGQAEVGINCAVGSCVTIVNCNLESGSIVAAGLILENQSSNQKIATEISADPHIEAQQISETQIRQNQIAQEKIAKEKVAQDQIGKEQIAKNASANSESNPESSSENNTDGEQTDLSTNAEVSPSSAIALNHAKAHLSKFMSKIQLI